MQLPNDLRLALERALRGIAPKQLAAVAAELSARYRADHSRATASFLKNPADATAYAATRMPATWAAVRAALEAADTRMRVPGMRVPGPHAGGGPEDPLPETTGGPPGTGALDGMTDWQPRSILDAGAGPGTASWAATAVWPSIERCTLLEREPSMIALGRGLASQANHLALRGATWRQADLAGPWEAPPHDLVALAYVLGELPRERRAALVAKLWALSAGMLVIVEPGTPRGYELILEARASLLAAGAHIVAPCPHAAACPLGEGDWCHFSQRIERSKIHRSAKGADLGYEDEKFAYLAVARHPHVGPRVRPAAARVLRHPQNQPGRIALRLCTPSGAVDRTVVKRDPDWKAARHAKWGDEYEL